jgi:DnaJ-class molecular chaperone
MEETVNEKLEELTAAIVKAVPEKKCDNCEGTGKLQETVFKGYECGVCDGTGLQDEFGLEDVLRAAFPKSNYYCVDTGGQIWDLSDSSKGTLCRWLLGKPLSEQSPETIAFLHSLLISA